MTEQHCSSAGLQFAAECREDGSVWVDLIRVTAQQAAPNANSLREGKRTSPAVAAPTRCVSAGPAVPQLLAAAGLSGAPAHATCGKPTALRIQRAVDQRVPAHFNLCPLFLSQSAVGRLVRQLLFGHGAQPGAAVVFACRPPRLLAHQPDALWCGGRMCKKLIFRSAVKPAGGHSHLNIWPPQTDGALDETW